VKGERLKSPKASERMKAWSSALEGEVADWPQVTTRIFFGFTALYRGPRIFGLLPRTRSMWTTSSIGFKLELPSKRVGKRLLEDPRVAATRMQKARWFSFTLADDTDLHDALDWIGTAYEATRAAPKRKMPKPK
jgi:hypothetical protein